MAHVYPSDALHAPVEAQHEAELDTLRLLAKALPNDYGIFHSLHWYRDENRYSGVGEVDFVIVNPSGQALIIEQKNGALEETDDGLVKSYQNQRKAVSSQIHRNASNIREKFQRCNGDDLDVQHLLYCPDYKVIDINGAAIEPSRIVDAASRSAWLSEFRKHL
jgi:hypothetical protein